MDENKSLNYGTLSINGVEVAKTIGEGQFVKAIKEVIKCCGSCSFCKREENELLCKPSHRKTYYNYKCPMYINGKVIQKDGLLITCGKCGQQMNPDGISETQKRSRLCEDCMKETPLSVLNALE